MKKRIQKVLIKWFFKKPIRKVAFRWIKEQKDIIEIYKAVKVKDLYGVG